MINTILPSNPEWLITCPLAFGSTPTDLIISSIFPPVEDFLPSGADSALNLLNDDYDAPTVLLTLSGGSYSYAIEDNYPTFQNWENILEQTFPGICTGYHNEPRQTVQLFPSGVTAFRSL